MSANNSTTTTSSTLLFERTADLIGAVSKTLDAAINIEAPSLEAKESLIDAAQRLVALARGPRETLLDLSFGHCASATLQVVLAWGLHHAVPLSGAASFASVAQYASKKTQTDIPPSLVERFLLHAISFGVFGPATPASHPPDGQVVHNAVSALLVTDPNLEAWLYLCTNIAYPAGAQIPKAIAQYGASSEPNETAYSVSIGRHISQFERFREPDGQAEHEMFAKAMKGIAHGGAYDVGHVVEGGFWWDEIAASAPTAAPAVAVINGGLDGSVAASAPEPEATAQASLTETSLDPVSLNGGAGAQESLSAVPTPAVDTSAAPLANQVNGAHISLPVQASNPVASSHANGERLAADPAISSAFTKPALVVDVGGGPGHVAIALARKYPSLEFEIQDLPETAEFGAKNCPPELKDRIRYIAHDFFKPQPVRDISQDKPVVYFARFILHDWSDKYAAQIIAPLAQAMRPQDRLILNEVLIPGPGEIAGSFERKSHDRDLLMLMNLNGRERTLNAFQELFRAVTPQLKVSKVHRPPKGELSLIEAVLATRSNP